MLRRDRGAAAASGNGGRNAIRSGDDTAHGIRKHLGSGPAARPLVPERMSLAAANVPRAMAQRGAVRLAMRAACIALATLLAGPASAAEPPPGSKNFTSPRGIPDYFSNETAPFRGGVNARPGPPAAAPSPGYAAPAPYRGGGQGGAVASQRHGRSHGSYARGKGSYRSAQRRGHGHAAHASARRSSASRHSATARGATAAAKAPHHAAPAKGRHAAGGRG
jgi:hypothetical protein